ncbi:putative membrane protein, partial [Vibrio cholerae HC-64A1]
MSENQK